MTTREPSAERARRSPCRRPARCPRAPRHPARARRRSRAPLPQAGVAEAGPALARGRGVLLLGLGDLVGRDPEQDDVVDHVGVARQHVEAGDELVAGHLRVEQEAAVVVGADAGRRRGRVGLRHPHGDPALARAQRLVADRAPRRPVRRAGVVRPPSVRARRRARRAAAVVGSCRLVVVVVAAAAGGEHQGQGGERPPGRRTPWRRRAGHPGGQVIARPPRTCRWAWKTVWWAAAPVLKTSR